MNGWMDNPEDRIYIQEDRVEEFSWKSAKEDKKKEIKERLRHAVSK